MRKWIVNKVLPIDKGDTGGGADAASKIEAGMAAIILKVKYGTQVSETRLDVAFYKTEEDANRAAAALRSGTAIAAAVADAAERIEDYTEAKLWRIASRWRELVVGRSAAEYLVGKKGKLIGFALAVTDMYRRQVDTYAGQVEISAAEVDEDGDFVDVEFEYAEGDDVAVNRLHVAKVPAATVVKYFAEASDGQGAVTLLDTVIGTQIHAALKALPASASEGDDLFAWDDVKLFYEEFFGKELATGDVPTDEELSAIGDEIFEKVEKEIRKNPALAGRRWTTSTPAALAREVKRYTTAGGAVPTYPRVESFEKAAISADAFTAFLEKTVSLTTNPARREIVQGNERAQRSALEAKLKKAQVAEADVQGAVGPPGSADQHLLICALLDLLPDAEESTSAAAAGGGGGGGGGGGANGANGANGGGRERKIRLEVKQTPDQKNLTAEDIRAQSQLRADAEDIEDDESLMKALDDVRATAAASGSSPANGLILNQKIENAPEKVKRLILASHNPGTQLTGLDSRLVNAIQLINSSIDTRVIRAIKGDQFVPSARMEAAVRAVRMGHMAKLKPRHLLDEEDVSTADEPLKGIAAAPNPLAKFDEVLAAVQAVVSLTYPTKIPVLLAFIMKLGAMVRGMVEEGVGWKDIGVFWRWLTHKIAQRAHAFSFAEGGAVGPDFQIEWVESSSDAKSKLQNKRTEAVAQRAAVAAVEKITAAAIKAKGPGLHQPGGGSPSTTIAKPGKKERKKRARERAKKLGESGDKEDEEADASGEASEQTRKPIPKVGSPEWTAFCSKYPKKTVKGAEVGGCWNKIMNGKCTLANCPRWPCCE